MEQWKETGRWEGREGRERDGELGGGGGKRREGKGGSEGINGGKVKPKGRENEKCEKRVREDKRQSR